MKIRILGSGTSTGVPVIGCRCEVCTSTLPKNKRTRSSAILYTDSDDKRILIDTSTDLRSQALANGIERIDSVLYTHAHADHTHGIDDLRTFNMLMKRAIPCYGSTITIDTIRKQFAYIFEKKEGVGWRPRLELNPIEAPFDVHGVRVVPIEVSHGPMKVFGYRFGSLAYLTDCSEVPKDSLKLLDGIDKLIVGALRMEPHPSHFSVGQAVELSELLGVSRCVLTHLGHKLGYERDGGRLPAGVELAYDGMEIVF